MKNLITLSVAFLILASCASVQSPPAPEPDPVVGIWFNPKINGGRMEVAPVSEGHYVMIQRSSDSRTSAPGEVIGQFSSSTGKHDFVGRHPWGGSRSETQYWGEWGGLVIDMVDQDRINVVFLDSRYTGGWIYTRVQ